MRLISRCALIGIYSVCTALIERVVKTGSGCALIREYALMRDMRLITQEYGIPIKFQDPPTVCMNTINNRLGCYFSSLPL